MRLFVRSKFRSTHSRPSLFIQLCRARSSNRRRSPVQRSARAESKFRNTARSKRSPFSPPVEGSAIQQLSSSYFAYGVRFSDRKTIGGTALDFLGEERREIMNDLEILANQQAETGKMICRNPNNLEKNAATNSSG
jgi:hypothetical protein